MLHTSLFFFKIWRHGDSIGEQSTGRFCAKPAILGESCISQGTTRLFLKAAVTRPSEQCHYKKRGKKNHLPRLHYISGLTLLCFLRSLLQRPSCSQHVTSSRAPHSSFREHEVRFPSPHWVETKTYREKWWCLQTERMTSSKKPGGGGTSWWRHASWCLEGAAKGDETLLLFGSHS